MSVDVEPRRRFPVDGVELAWDRWGADGGTELVLCHGYSGSAHDFALHLEALSADRPVLALDHRGHGRSTNLGPADGYTIGRLAADLAAWLAAVSAGPVDLLGHSMGGRIALLTALDHPELVRSLVLMDTSAWSFRPSDPDVAALVDAFFAGYDPAGGLPDPALLRGPEAALIDAATPSWWRSRRDELWPAFDPFALAALGTELFAEGAPSPRSRLGEVDVPVTIVVGADDHPLVDQAEELGDEIGARAVVVIDGAAHSPQLTHPDAWGAAIADHLAAAASGPR